MISKHQIDKNKRDFQEWIKDLQTGVEKVIKSVDKKPGAMVSGYILGQEPAGLAKFGNIENQGEDLIRLHLSLSNLAVDMRDNTQSIYHRLPFVEIDSKSRTLTEGPEVIADAMARLVLITGMDEAKTHQIVDLAQRYIMARRLIEKPATPDNNADTI